MKFYGTGIVWDKEYNKNLCKFNKHGEFETEDKRVIDILLGLDYKHDEVIEDGVQEAQEEEKIEVNEELPFEPTNHADMTNRELREVLEGKGHTGLERKNKKQLLALLEGE